MAPTRYSKQREAILTFLKSTTSHPTAEAIYEEIKKEIPNVSLGTIYRNLGQLVEQGTILSLTLSDGVIHYDGNVNPHHHFYCKCCERVLDIFLPEFTEVTTAANQEFSGQVEGHVIYFYGTCNDCIK